MGRDQVLQGEGGGRLLGRRLTGGQRGSPPRAHPDQGARRQEELPVRPSPSVGQLHEPKVEAPARLPQPPQRRPKPFAAFPGHPESRAQRIPWRLAGSAPADGQKVQRVE